MPDEKRTVEIEPPPAWAVAMSEKIARGFETTNARLSGIEITVDTLVEDGKAANQRMTRLEVRMDQLDSRASRASEHVRQTSENDLRHDAAIAQLVTQVSALASRPDTAAVVLEEMRKVAGNPVAKKIGSALLPLLMLAISFIGIRLQMQVSELEQRRHDAPLVVQAAPTLIDGGKP